MREYVSLTVSMRPCDGYEQLGYGNYLVEKLTVMDKA